MSFYDLNLSELENLLVEKGHKKFRAAQIFEWVYKKHVYSYQEMTNLPKDLISFLEENLNLSLYEVSSKYVSSDNETVKYALKLDSETTIEAVLMKYKWGNSLCISTQVGCNMGCKFCASGLNKKTRDLTSGEIISQILTVQNLENLRISNVVIMGIGEPFDNYHNTLKAIKAMTSPKMLEIAQRKITVSTSGLVPKILDYALEELQVSLAVSLHAPNDKIRNQIMPINKSYDVSTLIRACKEYVNKTSRRITFEYILLDGVNDSISNAHELSDLIRGLNAYVNLIMYNEVSEFDFKRSSKERALAFYDTLKKRGINVTLRAEKGLDIYAACGQLRRKVIS